MSSKSSLKYLGFNLCGNEAKQLKEKKRFLNLLNDVKFKGVVDQVSLLKLMEDISANWKTGFKNDKATIEKLKNKLNEEKALVYKYKKSTPNLKKQISKYEKERTLMETKTTQLKIQRKFTEYQKHQKIFVPNKPSTNQEYKKELNQIYKRCVTKPCNREFYTSEA
ncbi:unnamed protein product [Moneuplotes crassus]|uniref:Uncharacterized protein n=1 Tax=Euplotes crassus TaxID=5936 RepID=A0AAD1XZK9_EUPCR|nr:unnamed protein product [Moneuplotes crassus]